MKNQPNHNEFFHLPEYPGGKKALNAFIKSELKYPKVAIENNIEGKVYLVFEINNDGSVSKVQIRKGIGFGCDEEAKRLVSLLRFSPAHNKKTKVVVKKNIHIDFVLPVQPKSVEPTQPEEIEYIMTITPKVKSPTPAKTVYNYTVNLD